MTEDGNKKLEQPAVAGYERERISRQAVDELKRLCGRIGAEAQARGLTEENPKSDLGGRADRRRHGTEPDQPSRAVGYTCGESQA